MRHRSRELRAVIVAIAASLFLLATAAAAATVASVEAARALLERGRFAEAEAAARAELARAEAAEGRDSLEAASAIDLLVEALWREERVFDSAPRELAERAVAIKLQRLGAEATGTAISLANLARVQRDQGEFIVAQATWRRARAIAEKRLGPEDREVGRILTGLATSLVDRGDYAAARPLYERALAIAEKSEDRAPLDLVDALVGLAWIRGRGGEIAAERSTLERARTVAERAFGPDHPVTASCLVLLATWSRNRGGYAEAAALSSRALAIAEKTCGPAHPLTARALAALATVRRDEAKYDEAWPLYERAISILETAAGPDHFSLVWPVNQYGWSLYYRGDFAAARPLLERAVALADETHGPDYPETSWLLGGYGNLLRWTGNRIDAKPVLERALRLAESAPVRNDESVALALVNLGLLYGETGELQRARALFDRGIPLLEKVYGPEHPRVATGLHVSAEVNWRAGEYAEALLLMERGLRIREKALGPDHVDVAESLRGVGMARQATGDLAGARRDLERAAVIQGNTAGPDFAERGLTLSCLAQVLFDEGRPQEALATALEADRIGRESLLLTVDALAERQALNTAAGGWSDPSLAISMAVRGEADPGRVWDAVVRSRALVVDLMAARHRGICRAGDADTARVAAELASARAKLASLTLGGAGDSPADEYRTSLVAARTDKERLESDLAARSPVFRHESARQEAGLGAVAAALPADTALVAYTTFIDSIPGQSWYVGAPPPPGRAKPQPAYAALILASRQRAPVVLRLETADAIEKLIAAWRREAGTKPPAVTAAARAATERCTAAGAALRRAIWDPVARQLGGARHVLIVPDGALHFVNFGALPTDRGTYLVEAGPSLHYLSAERDLVREPAVPRTSPTLLAVGGPDFESAPSSTADVLTLARASVGSRLAETASDVYRGPRAGCDGFRSRTFENLPAAEAEADEIAALWSARRPAKDATLELTGAMAQEALFKRLAPGSNVLHVATHGFFLDPECLKAGAAASPLLSSGLALAGANHRDAATEDEEDGILTAEEIASLDLSGVDWVVLSACDTGMGQVMNGEGVLGLRRAFEVAGAGTLIMSLWPVQDEATRAWMRELYAARLAGASTADAMRRASVKVIEARRKAGQSAHPFYWGAFVAAGEWR